MKRVFATLVQLCLQTVVTASAAQECHAAGRIERVAPADVASFVRDQKGLTFKGGRLVRRVNGISDAGQLRKRLLEGVE